MLAVDTLVELVKSYHPAADVDLIRKAYRYSERAHQGQMRKSGDPYFIHPASVAGLITELRLDTASVCAGLLHDVLEDTAITNGDKAQHATNKEGDVEMADAAGSSGGRPTGASQTDLNGTLLSGHVTQDTVEESFIHPLFLAPQSSKLDRDLGLPEQESEDIRRLLQLYVQKQEEICRGTSKLYQGLLKADRYRNTVLRWAKAEAHCGPNRDMSDGEDWYDKEEWGLTEDLKKGQDEEEEDTVQTQKKTRNRK